MVFAHDPETYLNIFPSYLTHNSRSLHELFNLMLEKVDKLKIAFVTDIHLNYEGLERLRMWADEHYNNEARFDYCFIGGDTAQCHHDKNTHDEDKMMEETLAVHSILKKIFQCKMFFVPGNHDCKQFFTGQTEYDCFFNIHNRRMELAEGLDIVGFGGSVPGYVNGQVHWLGYPYSNQDQFAEEWSKAKCIETSSSKNQFFFLTHVGPQQSETSKDKTHLFPEKVIQTGSTFLNQYFLKKQMVGWAHGHSHEGSKLSKVKDILVMNPGALKNNEFMYFELNKENMSWKLGKKVYQCL